MVIQISEIITDPDFAQSFNIKRGTGTWTNGVFVVGSLQTFAFKGTILPLTTKDIKQMDIGDAITGGIKVYTLQPIYTTRLDVGDTTGGLSDEVVWQGQDWKILQVNRYSDFGYWRAICVRKDGA